MGRWPGSVVQLPRPGAGKAAGGPQAAQARNRYMYDMYCQSPDSQLRVNIPIASAGLTG